MLLQRKSHYGFNTSLSYEQPLCIVKGEGTYLYDEQGVAYLDCVVRDSVTHDKGAGLASTGGPRQHACGLPFEHVPLPVSPP